MFACWFVVDVYLLQLWLFDEAYFIPAERMKGILNAKYEPADLQKVVDSANYLSQEEKDKLYALFKKYEGLFNGTLGTWRDEPYDIQLRKENPVFLFGLVTIAKASECFSRNVEMTNEPADLQKVVDSANYLSQEEKDKLYALFKKYQGLFNGTLGTWRDEPYDIQLRKENPVFQFGLVTIAKASECFSRNVEMTDKSLFKYTSLLVECCRVVLHMLCGLDNIPNTKCRNDR